MGAAAARLIVGPVNSHYNAEGWALEQEDDAMNVVIHDPATVQPLCQAVGGYLWLTDSLGKVLGQFIPGDPIGSEPPITEHELRRLEQEEGRPLKDILADLEKKCGR
jgi:hypothetical protein